MGQKKTSCWKKKMKTEAFSPHCKLKKEVPLGCSCSSGNLVFSTVTLIAGSNSWNYMWFTSVSCSSDRGKRLCFENDNLFSRKIIYIEGTPMFSQLMFLMISTDSTQARLVDTLPPIDQQFSGAPCCSYFRTDSRRFEGVGWWSSNVHVHCFQTSRFHCLIFVNLEVFKYYGNHCHVSSYLKHLKTMFRCHCRFFEGESIIPSACRVGACRGRGTSLKHSHVCHMLVIYAIQVQWVPIKIHSYLLYVQSDEFPHEFRQNPGVPRCYRLLWPTSRRHFSEVVAGPQVSPSRRNQGFNREF